MKLTRLFVFACAIIILFGSCKESNYPIDAKPLVKIDSRLLGTWKARDKEGQPPMLDMSVKLTKQTDVLYRLSIKEKDKGKAIEEATNAYLSEIDKSTFLNVHIKDDTGGYIFFRILSIDAKGNNITAVGMADTTLRTAVSSEDLRARFTKNLNNPSFYKDTVEFYRVK